MQSLFGGGENGERIVVWDDGGAELLQEERKAWEFVTVSNFVFLAAPVLDFERCKYEPESDSEDEDSDLSDGGEESPEEDEDEETYEGGSSTGQKRRSLGDGETSRKRRRLQVSCSLAYRWGPSLDTAV